MKKILSLLSIFTVTLTLLTAGGKSDTLFPVIEDGSKEQIKEALSNEPDLVNATRGIEHQTILMAAAASDRDNEIITLLLKYGAKSKTKTSDGQTALMYAARFNTHPDVLHTLIEDSSFLNSTKKSKILDTDKYGRNTFDYVQENPNKENLLQILYKYVPASEVTLKDNEEENEPENIVSDRKTEIAEVQPSEKPVEETPVETYSFETQETVPEPTPAPVPVTPVVPAPQIASVPVTPVQNIEEMEVPAPQQEEQEPQAEPLVAIIEQKQETTPPVPVQETVKRPDPYKTEYLFDYIEMADENEIPPEDPNFNTKYTYIENADRKDVNGRTALMREAKAGNIQRIENLIFSGASVNAQDNDGWTPLMYASRFCSNEKVVSLLISKGANIKKKNNYGISSLTLAAGFNKNPMVVKILLDKHSISENDVKAAFLYALTNDAPVPVIDLFIKKGLKINIAYDGKTPLMHACKTNRTTKIIEYLLNNGAKKTYKSSEGKNAFQYAKENPRLPHDEIFWELNSVQGAE